VQKSVGLGIVDHGSNRNADEAISPAPARLVIAAAVSAALGAKLVAEVKIQEGRQLGVSDQDHVPSVTPVATRGTRMTVERRLDKGPAAIAAGTSHHDNLGLVHKHHLRSEQVRIRTG
jgi:hypothetical protein